MLLFALIKDILFKKNKTPRNTNQNSQIQVDAHQNTRTLFYCSADVTKDDPRNESRMDFKIWAKKSRASIFTWQ